LPATGRGATIVRQASQSLTVDTEAIYFYQLKSPFYFPICKRGIQGDLVIANLHPAVSAEAISSRVFCFSLYQREIKRDLSVVAKFTLPYSIYISKACFA